MVYWDRATLKSRAKMVLKNTYWMTFLAILIISILGGSSQSTASSLGSVAGSIVGALSGIISSFGMGGFWTEFAIASSIVILTTLVVFLFTAGYSIFLGNVMSVGKCRFLTVCRYGEVDLGQLFFPFKAGQYWNTVKVMFFRDLYVFLWSLLFVIPGIIKSYEYWMVPYILAENPGISKDRALAISSSTTQGEKWEIFVLQLSFIGWTLLGLIAGCGIGSIFVSPYVEATNAELYGALRYKAVMSGLCGSDEIGRELFAQNQ